MSWPKMFHAWRQITRSPGSILMALVLLAVAVVVVHLVTARLYSFEYENGATKMRFAPAVGPPPLAFPSGTAPMLPAPP